MSEFYHNYSSIIIPIHIFSAIIWLGSMFGYIVSTYPSLRQIPYEKLFVRSCIRTLRRLSNLLFIASLFLVISGIVITLGGGYEEKNPILGIIVQTKEALWIFVFLNTIFMIYKILDSKKMCLLGDVARAKDNIRLVSHYLIITNIFLGFIAAYFGMMLR